MSVVWWRGQRTGGVPHGGAFPYPTDQVSGEENQEKTNNHFGGLRLSVVFKATNLGEILQC